MAEKRKISIRKVLQAIVTLVVTVACITAMVSASNIEDRKLLKSVAVHIKNDKKYHFIEQNEIIDKAINERHIDVMQTPVGRLDLQGMEQVLKADPWVADAQVFIDNDCVLNIYVTQRIPVARLFAKDSGNSFYMDSSLSLMPLSSNYIFYTTVVTNVPSLSDDSTSLSLKKQLRMMIRTIQVDTFWNAQISQVVVDSNNEFELIPVLGNQRIIFGDTSCMHNKFDNLFAFYKKVLNRIGWDKYEVLDLRFKGQVVASPSLPYNGPVDRAVEKMNWISSIVETEAKNEAVDSIVEEVKTDTGTQTKIVRPLDKRINHKHSDAGKTVIKHSDSKKHAEDKHSKKSEGNKHKDAQKKESDNKKKEKKPG